LRDDASGHSKSSPLRQGLLEHGDHVLVTAVERDQCAGIQH
jgi:hypothetical protein